MSLLHSRVSVRLEDHSAAACEPHPSIQHCGHDAVYVFIFLRGYFNPRMRGVFPSVKCIFCDVEDGDSAVHMMLCTEPRIRALISNCVSNSGIQIDALLAYVDGSRDWADLRKSQMQMVGSLLRYIDSDGRSRKTPLLVVENGAKQIFPFWKKFEGQFSHGSNARGMLVYMSKIGDT